MAFKLFSFLLVLLLINSSSQAPSDRLKLLNARRPVNPEQVLNTQQVQSNSYQSTSYNQAAPSQQQYGPAVPQQYQAQPSYTTQAVPQQYQAQPSYTTKAVPQQYQAQPSYTTPAVPQQYQAQPSYTTQAVPQYQSQPSYNQVPVQQYAQTTQATYTTPRAVYANQPSYTTTVSQLYSQQVYSSPSVPVYQQPQRPAYSTPSYPTTPAYTQRPQLYQTTQSYVQQQRPQQYQQQQYNQPQPVQNYQRQQPQQTYNQPPTPYRQQQQQPRPTQTYNKPGPLTYQQRHSKLYQVKPNPIEDQNQYSKVNLPDGYLQNIRSYEQNPCLSNPCRFNKVCTPSIHVPEGYFCAENNGPKPEEKKVVAEQIRNVVMPAKNEIVRKLENTRPLSSNDNIVFLKAKSNNDACLNEPCTDGYKCVTSDENEDGYVCVPANTITTTTTTINSTMSKLDSAKLEENILTKLCLDRPNDRFPYPASPNKFIVCSTSGNYTIVECPNELVYNQALDRCAYTTIDYFENVGCSSSPCLYGGTCVDLLNGNYECQCPEGFYGDYCEKSVDPCDSNPCGTAGVCHTMNERSPLPYYCTCNNQQTYGLNCDETTMHLNDRNPCIGDSAQTKFETKYDPALYVNCYDEKMKLKFCPSPLVFSVETESCVMRNKDEGQKTSEDNIIKA